MPLDLTKVKITKLEAKKLSEVSSNWQRFHEAHKKKAFSTEALLKVLKLETSTPERRRPNFAFRVLGIYNRATAQANSRLITKALRGGK